MNPKARELEDRTRAFATRVILFCQSLPSTQAAQSISGQLIDSSGSTDSNYRAGCRARTRKEFIAKLGIVVEESDESRGWLRLLVESSICTAEAAEASIKEADELVAIFVQSEKTARRNYEADQARRKAARERASKRRR
jgi:four helix bundle protein